MSLPAPIESPTGVAFLDHQGRHWFAEEVDAARVPARRGPRCLILHSTDSAHRVWAYPADWRRLDAEGLVALLRAR